MEGQAAPRPTAWILWGALLSSHLVLAGLGQLLPTAADAADDPSLQAPAIAIFCAGLVEVGLAVAWAPRGLARVSYPTFLIVRMALAEAVATHGLVLALLGAPSTYALGLAGLALLTHLFVAPTAADRERHGRGR